jgi:hypothetical protein
MHPTRHATVQSFASKLRITAAVLGCASQKDLCAQFHKVNPATTFDLERSYKWMQGRALPRSAQVYEDWAALLGIDRPIAQLQSCSLDEFLDLVCGLHRMSRDALAARAGIDRVVADRLEAKPDNLLLGRHLAGAYACYSHSWSPYSQGKIVRGSLVIEVAPGSAPKLVATYSETVAVGRAQLRGPVAIVDRAVYIDVSDDAAQFRLTTCLFLPGRLASVLAGVISGVALVDVIPQPAATRIVMIRVPGEEAAALEASNGYLDPARTPLSSDLVALGLPVTAPAELDALLDAFLAADRPSSYIQVAADEYSRLTFAIDRLFIDSGIASGRAVDLPGAAAV